MTGKEQYYFLDEIGFIGDQSSTMAQVRRDAKRTDDYFKALKAGKSNPEPEKVKRKRKLK